MARMRLRWPALLMAASLLVLAVSAALGAYSFQITSISPQTIDPTTWQYARVTYTVPTTADFTVQVANSAGKLVRSLGSYKKIAASTRTAYWNGRDSYNRVVPNGTYRVTVSGRASNGTAIASAQGTITVSTASATPTAPTAKTITVTSVNPTTFDPSKGQTTTVYYTVPVNLSTLTNTVANAAGTTVRTLGTYSNVTAKSYIAPWNGKDGSGRVVADGVYTVKLTGKATDGAAVTGTATVTVKSGTTTTPTTYALAVTGVNPATIDAAKGESSTVTYTVPTTLTELTITVTNASGATVRSIGTYTNVAAGTRTTVWDGKDSTAKVVADGTYTVTLAGKATNATITAAKASVTVKTVVVTAKTMTITSIDNQTFDAKAGQTTTVHYTNPVTLTTLTNTVVNSAGTTVRTLGTYSNVAAKDFIAPWNGKTDAGAVVADGVYTIKMNGKATDGAAVTGSANVTVKTATTTTPTDPTPTDPTPSPTPTGTVQEFGYPIESKTAFNWEGWRYGDTKNKYGSAFTAQKTGTVTRLAMEWKTTGSYGAGNNGYYDLQVVPSDAQGLPDMTRVLATESNFQPLNGGQKADGWQLFNKLDRSFNVTAGQRYWMVISARSISSSNYSCPNTASSRAIKFVGENLYGMDGYVVADYNRQASGAWRGWISGDPGFPASWKSGASNTTHATQRGAIAIFYSDGSAQGQAGYWGSGGSGTGYDRIYNGMSVGQQIYWNRPNIAIDRLSIFIGKSGSPSANLNWTITNVTSGAVVKSGSISASTVPAEAGQINIALSPTIAFVKGQTYRISLSSSTSSSAPYRFWGACYDSGTATTNAVRYAAFTNATTTQTSLVYSTNGTTWTNGGNGRSGYAFDMPFGLRGWYTGN